MLALDTSALRNKHNLLAFSAGVDSSALFFLLQEEGISFDIAIVNYQTREQSKEELRHAKALAKKYKLFCHHINAPHYPTHFEEKARTFRYEFFESLIQIEGYDNLLTAHQLDDQLEWLLMRLSRGAGLYELLGLHSITQKPSYKLIRPLLSHPKASLLDYLNTHQHPYFIDQSNSDEKYERNQFRQSFSHPFMQKYSQGIQRSFAYLHQDKALLESGFETIYQEGSLYIIKLYEAKSKAKACDLRLKQLGYLLSASQRKEITQEGSLVIGEKWAIESKDDLVYISPYLDIAMPKTFKESCRVAKIPNKIRAYLFQEDISPSSLP
ncbi:MAG: tRNA lysidine(34) synthetase TilS [Sulfurovum sp.]|nr:tRNA lysidine(34) synthetase TilS [Sulfurovum sp.]